MRTLLMLLALAEIIPAQTPDLKRNQKLQRLSHAVKQAQSEHDNFVATWERECEAKGMTLTPVGNNLADCMPKPSQPAALATPVQPQSGVAEQTKESDAKK